MQTPVPAALPASGGMIIVQQKEDHANANPPEPGKQYDPYNHSTKKVGHYYAGLAKSSYI